MNLHQKVKGYIKAPKVGANGNEINFDGATVPLHKVPPVKLPSPICFRRRIFHLLQYVDLCSFAPFVKLLLNGSEMEMVDDDHYSIDLNLKQGDNITADIPGNFDQY